MTDDFDDAIRSRLHQPAPAPTGAAHEALGVLRPAMRRARFKRSLAVGTATLSVLGVTGLGVVAITDSTASDPTDVGILDGERLPEPAPLVPTTDDRDATVASTDPAIEAPTTTLSAEPTTTMVPSTAAPTSNDPTETEGTSPTQSGTTSPTETPDTPASAPIPATTNAPVPSTAESTPPTSPPPVSTNPPTTPATSPPTTDAPPVSGQRTVTSDCGSITVSYVADDISLVGTQPAAGFASEVNESGPEEVEVEFDDGDAECKIEAWIESGVLRTDVENDDDDDD